MFVECPVHSVLIQKSEGSERNDIRQGQLSSTSKGLKLSFIQAEILIKANLIMEGMCFPCCSLVSTNFILKHSYRNTQVV